MAYPEWCDGDSQRGDDMATSDSIKGQVQGWEWFLTWFPLKFAENNDALKFAENNDVGEIVIWGL